MAKDIGAFDKSGLHAELFTSIPARPQFKRWWAAVLMSSCARVTQWLRRPWRCYMRGAWVTRVKSWTESLAAMTITEWCNDDRLLGDLGGGQSTRMAKKWMDEMGFTWKQIPNLQAHSQADEKHSDLFLPFLSEHATGEKEKLAFQAAKDSLACNATFPQRHCSGTGENPGVKGGVVYEGAQEH